MTYWCHLKVVKLLWALMSLLIKCRCHRESHRDIWLHVIHEYGDCVKEFVDHTDHFYEGGIIKEIKEQLGAIRC